jgi:hypothetical protein
VTSIPRKRKLFTAIHAENAVANRRIEWTRLPARPCWWPPAGHTGTPSQGTAQHDPPLLMALTRAFYWQQLLEDGLVGSGSEIAKRERLHHSTDNELLRLTLLEPAIIQAIVAGLQPLCMSLIWFQRNPLPLGWMEQRRVLEAFDR